MRNAKGVKSQAVASCNSLFFAAAYDKSLL